MHQAHEQLWFDDIPTDNVGFFSGDGTGLGSQLCGENGEVRVDNGHIRNQYTLFEPVYDDNLMRQAVDNIRPEWDENTYCLAGINCQDFADALREEYDRIRNEQIVNQIPED